MKSNDWHILKNTVDYRHLFDTGILNDRDVIEFGVGTGVLTQLILEAGAKSVIGYELVPDVCTLTDPRFTLITADFTEAPITLNKHKAIVSNPPYSTLPFLRDRVLPHTPDVILMVPPHSIERYHWDYDIMFTLDGDAFEPPARGRHTVIKRGFIR